MLTPNVSPQRPEVFETVKLEHGYLRVTANATHMVHQVSLRLLRSCLSFWDVPQN